VDINHNDVPSGEGPREVRPQDARRARCVDGEAPVRGGRTGPVSMWMGLERANISVTRGYAHISAVICQT
jgi:hypothetical protein